MIKSKIIIRYYEKNADEMHAFSMQSAVDTIEQLQIKLTDFAKTHQSDIQDDPAFRQPFLQICSPLGINPLMGQKGFWNVRVSCSCIG